MFDTPPGYVKTNSTEEANHRSFKKTYLNNSRVPLTKLIQYGIEDCQKHGNSLERPFQQIYIGKIISSEKFKADFKNYFSRNHLNNDKRTILHNHVGENDIYTVKFNFI